MRQTQGSGATTKILFTTERLAPAIPGSIEVGNLNGSLGWQIVEVPERQAIVDLKFGALVPVAEHDFGCGDQLFGGELC